MCLRRHGACRFAGGWVSDRCPTPAAPLSYSHRYRPLPQYYRKITPSYSPSVFGGSEVSAAAKASRPARCRHSELEGGVIPEGVMPSCPDGLIATQTSTSACVSNSCCRCMAALLRTLALSRVRRMGSAHRDSASAMQLLRAQPRAFSAAAASTSLEPLLVTFGVLHPRPFCRTSAACEVARLNALTCPHRRGRDAHSRGRR